MATSHDRGDSECLWDESLVAIRAGFIIFQACFFAALAIFVILVATLCERAGLNRQRVYLVETVPITLRELLCAIGYYVETHCNL